MTSESVNLQRMFGQALVEQGLVSEDQLSQLLADQATKKMRLGEAALSAGYVAEEELAKCIASFFNFPYTSLKDDDELDLSAVELIPEMMARRYAVIVAKKNADVLTLVMADPMDVRAVDAVRVETGCRVSKMVASRGAILDAIDRSYHASSRIAKSINTLLAGEATQVQGTEVATDLGDSTEQLQHEASEAPVIQFVNLLLMQAIRERASDIHIEPEEKTMAIRLRVDGLLRDVTAPPKSMLQPVTTRIKLLGNLDIAERRLPQDGRFKFKVFDKTIDVRLSCLPTVYGEKLVLRILDRSSLILDLRDLGFEAEMLAAFNKTLKLPHGLVIITGPTGSGKTTTLYAALNAIRTTTKNIITIEDPVEYQIPKINQVHTRADIGLTFAAGLRSILRQDPDIIMVGEMRDRDTADICIRSALTGHLVLSTLHTNDAVSAVSRLTDMGIEPYLLSATLSMVMAQRLVRRICTDCAELMEPPKDVVARVKKLMGSEAAGWKYKRGKGCRRCGKSGYFGRIAIYEQFLITPSVGAAIAEGAKLHELTQAAKKDGLQTLLESALHKVRDGVTTLDEAFSVGATQSELIE